MAGSSGKRVILGQSRIEGRTNRNDEESQGIVTLILFFWFLRIFKPEWLISYYVPSLSILKPIPTVLLLLFLLCLAISRQKIRIDWCMLWFSVVVCTSTAFSENRGISFGIMRNIIETLLIYTYASTFINSEKSIRKLFFLYIAAFAVFSVWGIVQGGMVKAHLHIDDEDAFGPFMSIGIAISYFVAQREVGLRRFLCYVTLFLCFAGAIASFARGTFLSMMLLLFYIFMRTEEKAKLIRRVIVIILICSSLALLTIPGYIEKYSDEISTIWSEGAKEGTGKDRMYLWTRGILMFLDYPLLGVGPGCYGHKISSYITQQSADEWGVRFQMYGRAIHNIYLEILTDMGFLGLSAFLSLLYVFRRRNLYTKQYGKVAKGEGSQKKAAKPSIPAFHYALALEGGMLAFLANGFFFNLFYYAWFWDLLILNTLLYLRISNNESSSVQ